MSDINKQHENVSTQPAPTAGAPRSFRRSNTLVVVFAVLVVLLSLPYITEKVWYAAARGRERAKMEALRETQKTDSQNAEKLLAELPRDEGIIPWVAKSIAPAVVGIEAVREQDVIVPIGGGAFELRKVPSVHGKASGVIIGKSGHIVTNFHVVEDASGVFIYLSDGRKISDVEIVGVDPPSDLAVLKIGASGLTPAAWGDSAELEVGDAVIAVGNPFGLMRTVTSGIISAKGRKNVVQRLDYQDFLQTDAAVNPGNSGGPLVDMKGRVVGINTAIVGNAYRGISFAIPSKLAQEITQHLIKDGAVPRGWLGAAVLPLSGFLAERLGLKDTQGVVVARIDVGSPADKAELMLGDVIRQWDGQPIDTPHDLRLAAGQTKIGSIAKLLIIRNGAERTVEVKITKRPASNIRG